MDGLDFNMQHSQAKLKLYLYFFLCYTYSLLNVQCHFHLVRLLCCAGLCLVMKAKPTCWSWSVKEVCLTVFCCKLNKLMGCHNCHYYKFYAVLFLSHLVDEVAFIFRCRVGIIVCWNNIRLPVGVIIIRSNFLNDSNTLYICIFGYDLWVSMALKSKITVFKVCFTCWNML